MKNRSNYPRFMLLWTGSMISQIGGGLTSFSLGVYIFNRTGSAAQMALVTLLGFLPTLLLSVPAGVLADMFDRRALMMIGDGCSAIGIIYILICMNNGGAALWQICTGVFVSSFFFRSAGARLQSNDHRSADERRVHKSQRPDLPGRQRPVSGFPGYCRTVAVRI